METYKLCATKLKICLLHTQDYASMDSFDFFFFGGGAFKMAIDNETIFFKMVNDDQE